MINHEDILKEILREPIYKNTQKYSLVMTAISLTEAKTIKRVMGIIGKYESVCNECGQLIKTEPYCWENHIKNYHDKTMVSEDIENGLATVEDYFVNIDINNSELKKELETLK